MTITKPYLIIISGLLFHLVSYAQTNDPRKTYEEFRQQAYQEYSDFHKLANEQYANFLKDAWKRFHSLPAIPKPKEEMVPPVIASEEDKNKTFENNVVPIKEIIEPLSPLSTLIIKVLRNKYPKKYPKSTFSGFFLPFS